MICIVYVYCIILISGELIIDRPIHSNPNEPWLNVFLWLAVRVLSAPGASKTPYVVGEENSHMLKDTNDSKVIYILVLLCLIVLIRHDT